jgi:type II secretory pathway pseudopilin PulG
MRRESSIFKSTPYSQGFSLIELAILIVVLGFALSAIFLAFNTTLQNAPDSTSKSVALELANSRMEIILGQRRINGSAIDVCALPSPPSICTIPAEIIGYTITSTIEGYSINTDSTYQSIKVSVKGPREVSVDLYTLVGSD